MKSVKYHLTYMEKDNFITQAKFQSKLVYPKKCVNCDITHFRGKTE